MPELVLKVLKQPPNRDALDALLAEIAPSRSIGLAADAFSAFARELSYRPEMWQRLLAAHLASADGAHCVHLQCRRPGYGTLATRHPCSTRVVALTAQAVHEAREGLATAERKASRP